MRPSQDDDAVVDLLDLVLQDGVVVQADVVVTVADVPLVGINLRAAVAGMTTMSDYGMLSWADDEKNGSDDAVTERNRTAEPVP